VKGAIAISIHTLTPWHLHDTNLSPPSHTIPESNLGPSTIEQRLLHRTHEERNTTDYLSHVPRGLQERNSPAAQGSHSAYSTSPPEYTGRQTIFQNLASSTQIEPLKMTYIT